MSMTLRAINGWQIYFTLDGSDPRLSPTRVHYHAGVDVPEGAVIKAAAIYRNLSTHNWTDLVKWEASGQ